MNRYRLLVLTLTGLALAAPLPAHARPGFGYVGGGIGLSDIDADDLSLDGNEFARGLGAGIGGNR